jgi:hypothetical protein
VNPFSTSRVRPNNNRYRFELDPASERHSSQQFLEHLLSTLDKYRRAAIVGPHGTGKTTLLRSIEPSLQSHFDAVCWIALSSQRRHTLHELLANIAPNVEGSSQRVCMIVDGYEQLRWLDRILLVRHVKALSYLTLVVTSHTKSRLIPQVRETRCDPAMAKRLTEDKLAEVPEPLRGKLWSYFEQKLEATGQHPLNLRDLWFTMYDEFEKHKPQERFPL